jgi:hypothetical protein
LQTVSNGGCKGGLCEDFAAFIGVPPTGASNTLVLSDGASNTLVVFLGPPNTPVHPAVATHKGAGRRHSPWDAWLLSIFVAPLALNL